MLLRDIILQHLINYINEYEQVQQRKLSTFFTAKNDVSLNTYIQNYNVFKNSFNLEVTDDISNIPSDWNTINAKATVSINQQEELSTTNKILAKNANIENITVENTNIEESTSEIVQDDDSLDDNSLDDNKANNISDESENYNEERYEKQQRAAILLQEFFKKNHPELTLPEFLMADAMSIKVNTGLIHDFILKEKTQYDNFADGHLSFVSDFFPINNVGISNLIKNVRLAIKNKEINSAINIYKEWIKYLRYNGINYSIYDWNNFNDAGEFVQNISNIQQLDEYVNSENIIIMYDEARDKEIEEKKFQERVAKILSDGSYKSNFTPIHRQQQSAQEVNNSPKKELYVNK